MPRARLGPLYGVHSCTIHYACHCMHSKWCS